MTYAKRFERGKVLTPTLIINDGYLMVGALAVHAYGWMI